MEKCFFIAYNKGQKRPPRVGVAVWRVDWLVNGRVHQISQGLNTFRDRTICVHRGMYIQLIW